MLYNKKIFKRCFNFKGKQSWKNIKEIPTYCYLMRFLVKNGYDEYATWETFNWFIDVMKEILTRYKEKGLGIPYVLEAPELDPYSEEYEELNKEEWYSILNKMLSLLDKMSEKEDDRVRDDAKNEFFKLFSKYFYNFWD